MGFLYILSLYNHSLWSATTNPFLQFCPIIPIVFFFASSINFCSKGLQCSNNDSIFCLYAQSTLYHCHIYSSPKAKCISKRNKSFFIFNPFCKISFCVFGLRHNAYSYCAQVFRVVYYSQCKIYYHRLYLCLYISCQL